MRKALGSVFSASRKKKMVSDGRDRRMEERCREKQRPLEFRFPLTVEASVPSPGGFFGSVSLSMEESTIHCLLLLGGGILLDTAPS